MDTHRAHPWHGVQCETSEAGVFRVYIEVVPTDTVKYELDKPTGILRIDRPNKYSSTCPTLYGFLPRTYCGEHVGDHAAQRIGRKPLAGDGDPLDVCVLTERSITHGDILVQCRPVGGLRIIDGSDADDKILAVLVGDAAYGDFRDIDQVPPALVARLEHYFLTYKEFPNESPREVKLEGLYGRMEALHVIDLAGRDYRERFTEAVS